MFDKEYSFKGIHAEKVKKLTAEFDMSRNSIFAHNYDVYLVAPVVGFLYGLKADVDRSSDSTTKIFAGQFNNIRDDLLFNYRLILLLDQNYEPDFERRIDKAFRYYGSEQAKDDELLFEQYVRGGVDKIYEKIFNNAKSPTDYLKKLYLFMEEIEERYNAAIDKDSILDLCRLAKS